MKKALLLLLLYSLCPLFPAGAKDNVHMPEAGISPVCFYQNDGRITDQAGRPRHDIDFFIRSKGVTVFIGCGQLHYQFSRPAKNGKLVTWRMDVALQDCKQNKRAITEEAPAAAAFSDMTGHYTACKKITYNNIYPGIDWVLYVKDGQVEYDFVIRPGAHPEDIRIGYKGISSLAIKDGALAARTPMGSVTEHAPVAYEQQTGKAVPVRFVLDGNMVGFSTGAYKETLVIDPTLNWATYYGGGSADQVNGMTTDADGNIYICGQTQSNSNIATTGSNQATISGTVNAFLVKFDSTGQRLWGTYLGQGTEMGRAVICDAAGNVYLTGSTNTTTLATTGSNQTTFGGGTSDAFLAKFNSSGTIQWFTYFGGSNTDVGYSLAYNGSSVYLAGYTASTSGIATTGAYQATFGGAGNDAFLARFNTSGALQWSTYYGGSGIDMGYGVACDANYVYLGGPTQSSAGIATTGAYQSTFSGTRNAFLAKFNTAGAIQWGTYYGISNEYCYGVACDNSGNIYMAGTTSSTGLATTGSHQPVYGGGTRDASLTKFNAAGVLQWCTYYGGSGDEQGFTVACQGNNICLGGYSNSSSAIATGNGQQTTNTGNDAYLAVFNASGVRQWGTYFGGPGSDYGTSSCWYPAGGFYLSGYTGSTSGIATTGSHQAANNGGNDGFLARYTPANNCGVPTGLTVTAQTPGTVSFDWTANGTATQWDVEYGLNGFIPGTGTHVLTTTHPVTIPGLQANGGSYHFYVRSVCGIGDTSLRAGPATFTYPQTPVTAFPFTENWENSGTGWTIVNATQPNQWVVGTAVNNGGTSALYISNNNGVSNTYNVNGSATVHAFRDISFPAGSYQQFTLSFDWRNMGEGALPGNVSDRLRIWLVPTNYTPQAGTEIGPGNTTPVPASGAVQLGLTSYAGQSGFTNAVANIPGTYAGTTMRLVLEWHNDNSTGTQPPAAIDNIQIATSSCIASLPYNEGFESSTGTQLPACTAASGMYPLSTQSQYDYGTFGAHSGNRYMSTQYNAGSFFTQPIQLTAGTTYQFSAWVSLIGKSYHPLYRESALSVQYGAQPNAAAMTNNVAVIPHFATGTIATGDPVAYKQIVSNFTPATTGVYYFSIGGLPNTTWTDNIAVDDINIRVAPSCIQPDSLNIRFVGDTSAVTGWKEQGTATTWQLQYGASGFTPGSGTSAITTTQPYTLNGLSPATVYDFYVRSVCGAGDTSLWRGPFRFRTVCTPVQVPFAEGFELMNTCSYTLNANQDQYRWQKDIFSFSGDSMLLSPQQINDDWYYASPVYLSANTIYQLSFRYRATQSGSIPQAQGLTVYMGNNRNAFYNQQTSRIQADMEANGTLVFKDTLVAPSVQYRKATRSFTPTASGIYYIAFHDSSAAFGGSLYLDDVLLTIADIQTASLAAPANDTICAGTNVPLHVVLQNNGLSNNTDTLHIHASYTLGATTTSLNTIYTDTIYAGTHDTVVAGTMNLSPGVYTVKVYIDYTTGDTAVHNDTLSTVLTVLDTPSANAILVSNTGNTYSFSAGNPQYVLHYDWNFGDNSAHENAPAPVHTYTQDGSYTVTLIITNDCGADTLTKLIHPSSGIVETPVDEKTLYLYPNPANEQVSIFGSPGIQVQSITVYDSKAALVYESGKITGGSQQIVTSKWASGLYLLHIHTNKGSVIRKLEIAR